MSVDPEGEDTAGVQMEVIFDGNTLEPVSVKEGNLLNQNGSNTYFNVLNQGDTSISGIFGFILGNASVKDPGVFTSITFRAKSAGNSFIYLDNVKISGPLGNLLSVKLPSTTVLEIHFLNPGSRLTVLIRIPSV